MSPWDELTRIADGSELEIERVHIVSKAMAVEGRFRLPPLARLSADDQFFVIAFLSTHGSIKQMEQLFGISYPTVKNRLKNIMQQLEPINVQSACEQDILEQLEQGRISVEQAIQRLQS